MRLAITVVLFGISLHAHAANAPCDASVPVKGCRAEIALDGKFIVLTSNTPKCSVIEWTMDGSRRQTTVLDGEERIELLTTKPRELTIESCTQVKDLRAIRDQDEKVAVKNVSEADVQRCGCMTSKWYEKEPVCKELCRAHLIKLMGGCERYPDSNVCQP